MQAAIFNFADIDHSVVMPQGARFDAAARAALSRGFIDFLLVHYADGAYFHYDSVCFLDDRPWQVHEATGRRVTEILHSCPTWRVLRQEACERSVARALLLSVLVPDSAAVAENPAQEPSAMPVADDEGHSEETGTTTHYAREDPEPSESHRSTRMEVEDSTVVDHAADGGGEVLELAAQGLGAGLQLVGDRAVPHALVFQGHAVPRPIVGREEFFAWVLPVDHLGACGLAGACGPFGPCRDEGGGGAHGRIIIELLFLAGFALWHDEFPLWPRACRS